MINIAAIPPKKLMMIATIPIAAAAPKFKLAPISSLSDSVALAPIATPIIPAITHAKTRPFVAKSNIPFVFSRVTANEKRQIAAIPDIIHARVTKALLARILLQKPESLS